MHKHADLAAELAACAAQARTSRLTLGHLLERLDRAGYPLVCIVLSLPFLLPVSIWPLSTIGGMTFAVLGWRIALGRPPSAVPERIRKLVLPERVWLRVLGVWQRVYRICRRVARPRFGGWVRGRRGQIVRGALVISGGLLMWVPLPGIPFDNFFPACAIISASLAELEQDGLLLVCSFVALLLGVAYILLIVSGVLALGDWSFRWLQS